MKIGICEVCSLTKGDYGKKKVKYCKTCDANICPECDTDYYNRGRAAIIKNANKSKELQQWIVVIILFILTIALFSSCQNELEKIEPEKVAEVIKDTVVVKTTYSVRILTTETTKVYLNSIQQRGDELELTLIKGDTLNVLDEGVDRYTTNRTSGTTKREGLINIKIYIDNIIEVDKNCYCNLNYTKTF